MPYVLRANQSAIEDRITRPAAFLVIAGGFDGVMAWILELRERAAKALSQELGGQSFRSEA